ncbi:MAG TPA: hypothetical protein VHZ07_03175 [Bryobacteraceae bacterium]|jgi:hypothetical protein|nr:hypothetical protein [Bryobacteraceae bacterium]
MPVRHLSALRLTWFPVWLFSLLPCVLATQPADTVATLSLPVDQTHVNQPVTLTANAVAGSTGVTEGSIEFLDGKRSLGRVAILVIAIQTGQSLTELLNDPASPG